MIEHEIVVANALTSRQKSEVSQEHIWQEIFFRRILATLLIIFALQLARPTTANAGQGLQNFGDYAQIGAPLSAALITIMMNDYQGMAQLSASLVVGSASTHALKFATQKKRPDYQSGSKRDAFPSGHTSVTWGTAAYMRTRYGCWEFSFDCMKYTVPFTAVAAVTAYSRIDARKHDFADVLGGVLVAEAINWLMVDNFDPGIRVTPTFNNGFGLAFTKRF